MIIGVVGPICAGKDLLADILVSEHGFRGLSLADELREELNRRGVEITRVNLQDIGDELRKKDPSELTKRVMEKLDTRENYVITGFRNPSELPPLQALENFMVLFLDSDLNLRFERMKARGREKDPQTIEEFKKIEERDFGIGQPEHGQQNFKLFELAEKKILNDGTLDELKSRVSEMINDMEIEKD